MTTGESREAGSSASGKRPPHRQVLQEAGPATGRITGINHLVLFTRDMNEGVRFYRDLLGLRVVRTGQFTNSAEGLRAAAHHSTGSAVAARTEPSPATVIMKLRQVFFEMGNGELFSLYETSAVAQHPTAPVSAVLWPPAAATQWSAPREPQKMDHLAFDVPTHADLVWFREHLLSHGVVVSEISERRGADNAHRFISSIYFSDPSGNPLEIATFDAPDGAWQSYDYSNWFMDEDPVPALLADAADDVRPLVPHWVRPTTA